MQLLIIRNSPCDRGLFPALALAEPTLTLGARSLSSRLKNIEMTRSLHFVLITLLLMMAGVTGHSRYRRYAALLGSIKIYGAAGRHFFVTSCREVSA